MSIDMNKPDAGDATAVVAPVTQAAAYQVPKVNLLPPEIEEARKFRSTRLVLGGAVLGVVGLLAGGYLWATLDAANAADELAAEQATTQQLNGEKGKYARVPEVLAEVDAVRQARQASMTQDVLWAPQLDQIVTEMPADMTFKSLTMAFDTSDSMTDPLQDPEAVGSIVIEAIGTNHTTAAAWLEAAAKHPGYVNPYLSTSSYAEEGGQVKTVFTSNTRFTPEVYSGRYEPNGSKTAETGKVGQ